MAKDSSFFKRTFHVNGYGKNRGDCGDTVEMFICVNNRMIQDVSFDVDGCVNTYACANTVAHNIVYKRIDEAWHVTPDFVAYYLKSLPDEHFHCAELAVGALYLALTDFNKRGF